MMMMMTSCLDGIAVLLYGVDRRLLDDDYGRIAMRFMMMVVIVVMIKNDAICVNHAGKPSEYG